MRPNAASTLLQIGRKLEKWQWRQIFWHEVIIKFFWRSFVSFVKFSYWSKFHVNIIIGSGVMTNFFSPNIWRLWLVKNTKFGTDVSNKMILNVAKCQGYSFYRFWVIKWKTTGGLPSPHPPTYPPRLGLTAKFA